MREGAAWDAANVQTVKPSGMRARGGRCVNGRVLHEGRSEWEGRKSQTGRGRRDTGRLLGTAQDAARRCGTTVSQ